MLGALRFLTIFGAGNSQPTQRSLGWFPLVGAAIGGVLAGVWWITDLKFSPLLVSAIVLLADLLITRAGPFTGLAKSADGLFPQLELDERFEVLRSREVGVYAVSLVPVVLLIRWAAMIATPNQPLMFVAIWMMSRTLMAVVPAWLPYAHLDGSFSPLLGGTRKWFVVWLVPVALILLQVDATRGPLAIGLGMFAGTLVLLFAGTKLGGFTGGVLGAAVVVTETVALVAMVR